MKTKQTDAKVECLRVPSNKMQNSFIYRSFGNLNTSYVNVRKIEKIYMKVTFPECLERFLQAQKEVLEYLHSLKTPSGKREVSESDNSRIQWGKSYETICVICNWRKANEKCDECNAPVCNCCHDEGTCMSCLSRIMEVLS